MLDRSISRKTPKTSITSNTVTVLCAILILIAALAFLESHIRSIDHEQGVGAEIRSHGPREARRDAKARRTDGETRMAVDKSHIDRWQIMVGSGKSERQPDISTKLETRVDMQP